MLFCDCGVNHARKVFASRGQAEKTAHLVDAAGPDNGPLRVTGTWDYKWTPGTTIKIAIQDLPGEDGTSRLKDLVPILFEGLMAWIPSKLREPKGGPNLFWEIVQEPVPAPLSAKIARSDEGALVAHPFIEYDVLVSFARLPVEIPATGEKAPRTVNFPRCELGTYARRAEYGVPTIFLGPHQGFKVRDAQGNIVNFQGSEVDWLKSPEGAFTLIHELGHVFGLAHEQQNRLFKGKLNFRPMEQMKAIAEKRNANVPPPGPIEEFIRREITEPWPGDTRFSDWREPPDPTSERVDFQSVMAKPVYRCFLAGNHDGELDCSDQLICDIEQREFKKLTRPTSSDLDHLLRMYGSRV